MAGSTPALGKCEVCGDQLLEIRPFTPKKKVVCPTCLADENEGLRAEIVDLKSEASELRRELRCG